ncbi:MAG: ribokinase [Actinobacteria bacterium]|nr:ribokinase [Actinomycetota bacterium]
MPEITVVGSLNLDATVRVPRLPLPGETVMGRGHAHDTGGKGANQAVAAARLGRSVAMVGMVGRDDAGDRLLAALDAAGVATATVRRSPSLATGLALVMVDDSAENSIVVIPAANGALAPEDLDPAVIGAAAVVLLQLEIPPETVEAAVGFARGTVVLNPAPAHPLPAGLLARVDVLVPNRTELALLAGAEPPATVDEAAGLARSLGGPRGVVVTLGAEGALVVTGEQATHVPAPRVDAVDPTGAGDAFCAGLADALVGGADLLTAARWAVRCGAAAVTRRGAQASLPTRAEVEALGAGE